MKRYVLYILVTIIMFLTSCIVSYGYTNGLYVSVAPLAVNFHIVDPMGRISGYTPAGEIADIPYMGDYLIGGLDGDFPITNPMQEWHKMNQAGSGQRILNGKYKLVLYGTNILTMIDFAISLEWSETTQWTMGTGRKMTIWPNAVWTYEFDVPVTPTGTQIVLTKIASSNDLIADINSANQAGYFTTPGIYQSLLSKAQDAQAKLVAGQTIPAKNILNAFINDINAQKGKQINTIAADILIEDAQYIINHI